MNPPDTAARSPGAAGTWPLARRAGDFIFVGGHTPHDMTTGHLVLGSADLSPADSDSVRAPVLFTEVVAGRVRAQTWQALQNLKSTLEAMGSSLGHAAHLRIFLRDIAHEGTVLDLVRKFFGANLCSGEILEARNSGSHPEILVQLDCIALAADAGDVQHLGVEELERLTAPFPVATKAGCLLFSSQVAGADPVSGEAAALVRDLNPRARRLLGALEDRASRQSLPFFVQQAAMWDHLLAILQAAGVDAKSTLYHMNWMKRPMSVFADGSVTRSIMEHTGDYLLTCFPASGLRTPAAELEGRIVAILPESGIRKDVRVPLHGISNSYFGAIKAGPYLFAAGEVPVDTAKWTIVDRETMLAPPRNLANFGKPYESRSIQAQANYIYSLYEETLAAYGGNLSHGVHQTIYLCDGNDGPALEGVIADRFAGAPPATTIVPIVGASPFEATRLELELTAYIGD